MGIEYRIRFQANHSELDGLIRGLRFFANYDAPNRLYILRSDSTAVGELPNGWVSIESDGLIFCDNGGSVPERAMILRSVIDLALQQSQRIEVEQL